jgi:hypothetical protein
MKTHKAIELFIDEARQILVNWVAETLVDDPVRLRELILTEGFDSWYGPVANFTDEKLADRISELDLAQKVAEEHDADMVFIRLNAITNFVVYEREETSADNIVNYTAVVDTTVQNY